MPQHTLFTISFCTRRPLPKGYLTESPPTKQGIGILECCRSPFRVFKIVCQQALSGCLLLVPVCHSPQTLEDRLLPEREVVKAAVNRVFDLVLCVLVSGDQLELSFLGGVSYRNKFVRSE